MIPIITSPNLARHSGIAHGFFTRQGGVSSGIHGSLNCGVGSSDDPDNVRTNRARVAEGLGVSAEQLATPYQVHGTNVVRVTAPISPNERPRADGLVTNLPGLAIAVGIADCGPVLFADAKAGVVGAAHAGWQGAFTGVLEATIAAMEALGASRANIDATLGPTISRRSYEVGPEFFDRFIAADPGNQRFFAGSSRAGHYFFDLPAYILARLGRLGLASSLDLGLCTYEDEERFFSFRRATHRREPDYGRMLAGIRLDA